MSKLLVPCTALLIGLAGCSPARAAILDPTNEIDCSVLLFYFHGLVRQRGTDAPLMNELRIRHEWQAAKIRSTYDGDTILRRAGPVLAEIKRNPAAVEDAIVLCVNRQNADPGFHSFWRRRS